MPMCLWCGKDATCHVCGGKGRIPTGYGETTEKTCYHCSGTGQDPDHDIDCIFDAAEKRSQEKVQPHHQADKGIEEDDWGCVVLIVVLFCVALFVIYVRN